MDGLPDHAKRFGDGLPGPAQLAGVVDEQLLELSTGCRNAATAPSPMAGSQLSTAASRLTKRCTLSTQADPGPRASTQADMQPG